MLALQRLGRALRKSPEIPDKIALIFEFNWVANGQVFVDEFLQGRHQLGNMPEITEENKHLEHLTRDEVELRIEGSAPWEINWDGKEKKQVVRKAKGSVPLKVTAGDVVHEMKEVNTAFNIESLLNPQEEPFLPPSDLPLVPYHSSSSNPIRENPFLPIQYAEVDSSFFTFNAAQPETQILAKEPENQKLPHWSKPFPPPPEEFVETANGDLNSNNPFGDNPFLPANSPAPWNPDAFQAPANNKSNPFGNNPFLDKQPRQSDPVFFWDRSQQSLENDEQKSNVFVFLGDGNRKRRHEGHANPEQPVEKRQTLKKQRP